MDSLRKIQKKARKQSSKKGYWGWFQNSNAGNVPVNNTIFNSMMDTSDIAGAGEADGGIGAVGAVGEDFQINKEGAGMPEQVKFYYSSESGDPDAKWYQQEVSEVVVDKEDVITALCHLLAYDPEFVDMTDQELRDHVELNWRELKDEFSAQLFDIFNHKIDGTFSDEDFTDEFYHDDDVKCDCEQSDYEEDPYLTQYMFDGIDSEDPEVKVTEYEPIRYREFLDESYDHEPVVDFDKLLDQAYDFGFEYGFEGDSAFTRFVRKIKAHLDDDQLEQLRAAFDNGNHEGEMYDDARDYMEEFDESCKPKVVESSHYRAPSNPYDEAPEDCDDDIDDRFLDSFYGYDPDLTDLHSKRHQFDGYLTDDGEGEQFDYDDDVLEESAMSNLDLDLQDPHYIEKLQKEIDALEDEIDFLKTQAPHEIRRGGAFDSQEEIDDAIEATERELNRSKAKMAIINKMEDEQE